MFEIVFFTSHLVCAATLQRVVTATEIIDTAKLLAKPEKSAAAKAMMIAKRATSNKKRRRASQTSFKPKVASHRQGINTSQAMGTDDVYVVQDDRPYESCEDDDVVADGEDSEEGEAWDDMEKLNTDEQRKAATQAKRDMEGISVEPDPADRKVDKDFLVKRAERVLGKIAYLRVAATMTAVGKAAGSVQVTCRCGHGR